MRWLLNMFGRKDSGPTEAEIERTELRTERAEKQRLARLASREFVDKLFSKVIEDAQRP